MPSHHANLDGFKYIKEVGSVTAEQFALAMNVSLNTAKCWLSRWTGKGYLEYIPPERYTGHKPVGRPSGGKYKYNYWHLEEE
jgi:predicted ArsR family transcriptional regulator